MIFLSALPCGVVGAEGAPIYVEEEEGGKWGEGGGCGDFPK